MASTFHRLSLALWLALGLTSSMFGQESTAATSPVLRVVYFSPSDRQPEPDRVERLDRVLTEVQRFFREGMQQQKLGERTFPFERDPGGKLKLYEVRGQEPMTGYGRNDSRKVREEVKAALKSQLDIDRETIIIFQQLLKWDGPKAIELGPYVGGGNAFSGTAWVFDDAKLDPRLLASTEPGGYYNGPCSLGKFNTHYLGGVAHELGHALGLPHETERPEETGRFGSSLMGAGNHTYGNELRGEGRGTFLSSAAALPLSVHPLFTGQPKASTPLTCQITEITAETEPGRFTLRGQLTGGPRVIGVVAYSDPQEVPGDYDAFTATSPVDQAGRFDMSITDLKPGLYELRLRPIGAGGDTTYFHYSFEVDAQKLPHVESILEGPWLRRAFAAYGARDGKQLARVVAEARRALPQAAALHRKLAHYQKLATAKPPRPLSTVPAAAKSAALADLVWDSASTGWGPSLRNQVAPNGDASGLLEVGGRFFESGLYAHAPASHVVTLTKGWKTLSTQYGLQDRHDGSAVFVIKGDGKELFRSPKITDHQVREQSVKIDGVARLELVVEDAGDGANSDWGVWLNPTLQR